MKRFLAEQLLTQAVDVVQARQVHMRNSRARSDFVKSSLLELVRASGFDRARYFEPGYDAVRRTAVWVLVGSNPSGTKEIGTVIQASAWTNDPPTARVSPPSRSATVAALGLSDQPFVEIPLLAGLQIAGLIVAEGDVVSDLSHEDLRSLDVFASVVGAMLVVDRSLEVDRMTVTASEAVMWSNASGHNLDERVRHLTEILAEALDAAAAALFVHDWPSGTLRKISDYLSPRFARAAPSSLAETYVVGDHLTGRAWSDAGVRHIMSFDLLAAVSDSPVESDAMTWHDAALGTIRSVMFARLDDRYLLRFINRASTSLPFLTEWDVLNRVARTVDLDLARDIDARRIDGLQRLARASAAELSPDELLPALEASLADIGVSDFIALAEDDRSSHLRHIAIRGTALALSVVPDARDLTADPLYIAGREPGLAVVSISRHGGSLDGPIATVIASAGFDTVITVSTVGRVRACLLIPVSLGAVGTDSDVITNRLPRGAANALISYCALYAASFDVSASRAQVDGARKAFGVIGHELRGPIAALGSAAEAAINDSIRAARALDSDSSALEQRLRERRHDLNRQLARVSQSLALARIISLVEDKSRLRLRMEPADLRDLVIRAVDEAAAEARESLGGGREFSVAPSVRSLELHCDATYVAIILRNVLQNAWKYSLADVRGNVAPVQVSMATRDRVVEVDVRNCGRALDGGETDTIFDAFSRGSDPDSTTSGMGLGLYLARRLARAHDGDVTFESGRPSHGDEAPGVSVNRTTILLSRALPPGLRVVEIDNLLPFSP